MSADRSKVYENAFTSEDLLRARGASEKEIAQHRAKMLDRLLNPRKKQVTPHNG